MRAYIRKLGGKAIRHQEIKWNLPHLFRPDGVHLNDMGNDVLIGVFRNSIRCFEKKPGGLQISNSTLIPLIGHHRNNEEWTRHLK